jgi:uncharacterized protein
MEKVADKHLGCVIKIVERCNINCSYCYFFYGGDESYKKHPPFMSREVITSFVSFLINGINELRIKSVSIGFHGGEPLLYKKHEFDWCCNYIRTSLEKLVQLEFTIQTNGTLLDDEWVNLLAKHRVSIGISIDGPKQVHDKYRLDHFGRGTYDRVKNKILFIKNHPKLSELEGGDIGALGVVNPQYSGREAYRHLVDDLQFKKIDFLLPDNNYKNPPAYDALEIGKFMCEVFEEWVKDDDPKIQVRFCVNAVSAFLGKTTMIYGIGKHNREELPLFTMASNGDLAPVDELRTTDEVMYYGHGNYNVSNISLKNYLETEPFQIINAAQFQLPKDCNNCCWENVCYGGGLVHRYSIEKKFDNPSIYCEGLKSFYSSVFQYLLSNGYELDKIKNVLFV